MSYGLVQISLSNFRKQIPNLKANLSSNNNQNYTNIIGCDNDGKESTNEVRAATQRDLQLTNGEQAIRGGGKRKVEPAMVSYKKRQENTDFAGISGDQN